MAVLVRMCGIQLMRSPKDLHIAWSGPLQIILAFISLYRLIGWQSFVGVAIMVISVRSRFRSAVGYGLMMVPSSFPSTRSSRGTSRTCRSSR